MVGLTSASQAVPLAEAWPALDVPLGNLAAEKACQPSSDPEAWKPCLDVPWGEVAAVKKACRGVPWGDVVAWKACRDGPSRGASVDLVALEGWP